MYVGILILLIPLGGLALVVPTISSTSRVTEAPLFVGDSGTLTVIGRSTVSLKKFLEVLEVGG